jgi:hypothetical protein
MLSLQELQQIVSRYLEGNELFDDFAGEYRRVSRGKFGADGEVLEACLKIDAALSMIYFDSATELEFRQELAIAVRPFALRKQKPIVFVYDERPRERRIPLVAVAAVAATVLWIPQPDALRSETPNRNTPTAKVLIGSPSSNTASASWSALPATVPVHAES